MPILVNKILFDDIKSQCIFETSYGLLIEGRLTKSQKAPA